MGVRARRRWIAAVWAVAMAAVVGAPPVWATHYPPGWKCYECHAVSASKIVPGTHLIKQSQKTFDLGITSGDPSIRCLFCHEAFRSAQNPDGLPRDRMKGVDEHFSSSALSKHPVDVQKSKLTQDATAFDCLDCHTVAGFDLTNPANPNIHGVDASQAILPVEQTLVGSPLDTSDAEISVKTCQSANCHDGDGGALNGYTAPPRHSASNAKLTLNDAPVASGSADADAAGQIYCTKCHASHGSLEGEMLLALPNTSGSNGQPATGKAVGLDECDVCHTQDENGGLTDNFYAYGHGRIVGGGCAACHELRHDANGDNLFDPAPRLKLAEDTSATSTFSGTYLNSNCKSCHRGHANHSAPTDPRRAGCLDCHDPHGTTAADATFQNDTMIRRSIQGEEVRLPGDPALIGPPPPDGTGDTYDGDWFNPGSGSPAVTTGVCDNVACHTALTTNLQTDHRGGTLGDATCSTGPGCHTTHLQAGRQGKTFGAASCDGCHGFPPATNAHTKHVDVAGFACEACHGQLGGAGGTSHNESGIGDKTQFDNTWATNPGLIRNNVDLDLAYDGTNPNGFYSLAKGSRPNDTTTYGTCNALYCHGDDTTLFPAASRGTDTTPEWNGAAACGTCHGATAAAPPGSNAHPVHAGSAGGYALPCNTCHVTTTADGVSVIYPAHVNGQADVAFDPADARLDGASSYAGDAAVGSGYGACSATYCHSQGLDRTKPFTGQNTAALTAVAWDGAAVCSTCHGFGPSYANDTPIEAGTKKNSHAKHASYGCEACHQPTTTTGTTITDRAQHVDVGFDLAPDTGAGVSFTVTTLGDLTQPTSCASISCHGGGSATWGQTLSCDSCHFSTSDTDDFSYLNGTTATVSQAEWDYSGHGKASGTYDVSGNAAAAFAGPASDPEGCAYCHDFSVTHGTATNPFRLANQGVLGRGGTEDGGWNDVCLTCHSTLDTDGYDPDGAGAGYAAKNGKDVDANHYGTKHDAATDGGTFCWDCHDPHGDRTSGGGNIYMVQRAATQVSDGTYGVPSTTVTPVFTNNATGTDYAKSAAPYNGVCQVCHTATAHYTSTSGDGHNSGLRCTSCHPHSAEFAPNIDNNRACAGCHTAGSDNDDYTYGNANTAAVSTAEWADSGHGRASGTYDVTGNPAAAFSGPGDDPEGCNYCHDYTVPHGGANYFRLANRDGATASDPDFGYGWNNVCLVCHAAGDAGYDPDGGGGLYTLRDSALDVDENHYGAKHAAGTGGTFCWDCHDPHGDRASGTGNISMIHRTVSKTNDQDVGKPGTTVAVTFTANTTGTDYAKSGAPYDGICNVCHTSTNHYTSSSGDGHNSTARCTNCHKHQKEFGASCVLCHGTDRTTDPTAPQVVWEDGSASGKTTAYGSHLKATTGDALSNATDWDVQCNKCHSGHSGPVTVPLPPTSWNNRDNGSGTTLNMQTQLGIDYTANGGIHLGGTATSGTTEAEICWNCHGTDDTINEWGYNADTNGASFPVVQIVDVNGQTGGSYNYGWLYSDSGWTTLTPYWVDASGNGMYRKDGYQHDSATTPSFALSRRISSVHSVDFTVGSNPGSSVANNVDGSGNVIRTTGAQTLESRAQIRCSYCHDVHDLNKAVNDTQSGRPHLRGTWMGNPYPPDVPPLAGYSYPTTGGPGPLSAGNRFSFNNTSRGESGAFSEPVPRLWADPVSRNKGGYFIDANSGRPTDDPSYDTLAETAGLCILCHGSDVDNMDYYTGSSLWRFGNGHSNSTLGGTGANASNLFDARRTTGSWLYMAHQEGVNVFEYGNRSSADSSGPFRSSFNNLKPAKRGGQYSPPRNTGWYGGTPGSTTRGGQYSTWYSASGIGTDGVNATAHKFPCSKCHSPHATGLPALLITNCLDKNVSNWTAANGRATPSVRQANNCHRNEGTTSGWHRLNVGQ